MTLDPTSDLITVIADRLASPDIAPASRTSQDWWRQSLAHGIPGIALLHIELASAGLGSWQRAHDWLAAAARAPITSGPDSHPYYGAPAFAHALTCAAELLPGSYQRTLDALDRQIATDVQRRVADAHRRIDLGHLPALAEFDALRGLAGYGVYLLRRNPDSDELRGVLDYLVRLTDPLTVNDEVLPGWWTSTGPSGKPDDRFPDGHANNGLAHGITGVLSLLSKAIRRGCRVDGQVEAIQTICTWLDRWRDDSGRGPAWPYWITRDQHRKGDLTSSKPTRPSWCYGTTGMARAQQLAALAIDDTGRQLAAERAVIAALTDPDQLAATTDISLCHGYAGLAHIATRMADDALPATAGLLRSLTPALLAAVHEPGTNADLATMELINAAEHGPGLLDGAAGVALAVLAASTATPPRSEWDACLLS